MTLKRILCILLFVSILSGCQSTSIYDVVLGSRFEYKEDTFDVCQVIDEVNGTKIRDFHREEGKIEEGDYHIACPIIPVKKLGKQEVTIQINNSPVVLNFIIQDTTPPKISVQKTSFEVEKGNQYFDIKKLVSVKDLYDPNPIVGFSGDVDMDHPGTYTVEITTTDSKKNKSEKRIEVIVTEKQVEIIEKQVLVNNSSPNDSYEPSNSFNGFSEHSTANSSNSPLTVKEWLFSQGYNMSSGFKACQSYRGSNAGSCSPLMNGDEPYGYIYQP